MELPDGDARRISVLAEALHRVVLGRGVAISVDADEDQIVGADGCASGLANGLPRAEGAHVTWKERPGAGVLTAHGPTVVRSQR
jgi:hypothetical protein